MNEKDAAMMAQVMTECYASTQGCKRMPVRMLAEIVADDAADAQFVMMCVDHAAIYQPQGQVIFDKTLSDEQIQFFTEHGL